jgi:hypothetical protein
MTNTPAIATPCRMARVDGDLHLLRSVIVHVFFNIMVYTPSGGHTLLFHLCHGRIVGMEDPGEDLQLQISVGST